MKMLLKMRIRGENGSVASGSLYLDFNGGSATIVPGAGWARTGMSHSWKVDRSHATGSIYLVNNDTLRYGDGHGFKLERPPFSETDTSHLQGFGEMRSAISHGFSTAKIAWRVPNLSPLRQQILDLVQSTGITFDPAMKKNFPNGPPSDALKQAVADFYRKNNNGKDPPKLGGKTTNCGEFPGYILERVAGDKPADLVKGIKVGGSQLSAKASMTAWADYAKAVEAKRGTKGTIWNPWYSGCGRPRPGDVHVLRKKPSGTEFGHVGIVVDSNGALWTTADSGQGDGFGSLLPASCLRSRIRSSDTQRHRHQQVSA